MSSPVNDMSPVRPHIACAAGNAVPIAEWPAQSTHAWLQQALPATEVGCLGRTRIEHGTVGMASAHACKPSCQLVWQGCFVLDVCWLLLVNRDTALHEAQHFAQPAVWQVMVVSRADFVCGNLQWCRQKEEELRKASISLTATKERRGTTEGKLERATAARLEHVRLEIELIAALAVVQAQVTQQETEVQKLEQAVRNLGGNPAPSRT